MPRSDLCERPVPARIEINPQRVRMRINRFLFHVAEVARLWSLKPSNSAISARPSV
jgi:hypothetical protein